MDLQFLPATETDIPAVAAMMADFYTIDGYPYHRETAMANLLLFIQHPSLGRLWLLQAGSGVAGYVVLTFCFSFEFGGKTAFIDELYLLPGYRGQGYGTRAIEFVCSEAGALGLAALHLEVENHNEAALRLYRRFGFRDHHRMLMTKPTATNERDK